MGPVADVTHRGLNNHADGTKKKMEEFTLSSQAASTIEQRVHMQSSDAMGWGGGVGGIPCLPDWAFFFFFLFLSLMRRKSFCLGLSFGLSLTGPGEVVSFNFPLSHHDCVPPAIANSGE